MRDPDVVIIGAGHNGLAAALVLAKSGFRVTVLEARPQPGGAAKSGELTLPGFIHDYYASNIGLFLGSPIYREFGSELHKQGLAIEIADQPYGSVFPDDRALPIYTNSEATSEAIGSFSARDVQAWQTMVQEFQAVSPFLFPLLQLPIPSWAFARALFRLGRGLGWHRAQELFKTLLESPRQFVESRFESREMQALLIPWGYHLDFAPDVSGGATFPFLESMVDFLQGMAITRGGISRLIASMVSALEARGGQVLLNTAVTSIVVHNHRAVAVRTESGEEVHAQRAVVANVTPSILFGRLLDPNLLPNGFLERVKRFRYGPGTMMVHLALSGPVPWRHDSMARSLYVHIAPYVDDVALADWQARQGYLPVSPMLVVGQQSVWDRQRAPEGAHTLWVQVRSVPAHPIGDAKGEIAVTPAWDDMKGPYAERVIEKIEHYAPGLRSRILSMAVLSPADLERDNPNLVGGDSVSGSHYLDQFYLFRPIPGWSRYRTPIRGLWMIGASTWPGGGLNATSGYLAARDIVRTS